MNLKMLRAISMCALTIGTILTAPSGLKMKLPVQNEKNGQVQSAIEDNPNKKIVTEQAIIK